MWSKITLVFDTNSQTKMSQNYDVTNTFMDRSTIMLQIHQPKELANMIIESSHDKFSGPITLQNGYEYMIDIHPYGQVSTNEFRRNSLEQRGCRLDHEVDKNSKFNIYTRKNCKYSCHVKIANVKCGCTPWDFITNNNEAGECDVFGRICFYNEIQSLTKSPNDPCNHCITECDYLKFRKELTSKESIGLKKYSYFEYNKKGNSTTGSKAFIDFLMDENNTLIDEGLKKAYDVFAHGEEQYFEINYPKSKYMDLIVVHLQFREPEINVIASRYSIFDMIGTFGGQLGILEKLTGASLLGMLNLILILFKLVFSSHRNT